MMISSRVCSLARRASPRISDRVSVRLDFGMDESFYVIPSVASPSMKALQSENATLKLELQSTKTRLSQAEKAIKTRQEQERILRDSIISVRKEVSSYLLHYQSVLKEHSPGTASNVVVDSRRQTAFNGQSRIHIPHFLPGSSGCCCAQYPYSSHTRT